MGETNKDKRMMKMAMKRKTLFGMLDIRLSQLTCKIFETGTNANSADLLAPKNPEGFSNELTLTMVGCPEQGEYRSGIWMAQCVRSKQGTVKWRLRTLQAACHCGELSFGSFCSTKLTTIITTGLLIRNAKLTPHFTGGLCLSQDENEIQIGNLNQKRLILIIHLYL